MEYEITNYLDYLKYEKKLSDNTLKSYANDLEEFLKFFGPCSSSLKLEEKDIINFLKTKGNNVRTHSHYLSTLKGFYTFLNEDKDTEHNPCKQIPFPKVNEKSPNYLTYEEVDKLLNFPLKTVYDYRTKAMLEILYATGLRISELVSLKDKNIDFQNEWLRIEGKGQKERIVPLNETSLYYLKLYLDNYRSKLKKKDKNYDELFLNNRGTPITRQGMNKLLGEISLKTIERQVNPHMLRHSFATHLLLNGANLRVIQTFLGHSSITTTEIYTHFTSVKNKEEYDSFHPHAKK